VSTSPTDDSLARAVSETVTRLFLEKFGRGPMLVETFFNGDVVTTLLRDVFTPAERSMIAAGKSDSVLTTRMLWQQATSADFKNAVAEVVGRPVLNVISGFELDDEMATEVFVLAPASAGEFGQGRGR
jgi:uncharacterized protein YbcI